MIEMWYRQIYTFRLISNITESGKDLQKIDLWSLGFGKK